MSQQPTAGLVLVAGDGTATTTSLIVAEGTGAQHASVLRLIRGNLVDFEEFGLVGFQIRPRPTGQHGGGDTEFAVLNEEHATLLLTYMRNSDVVREFKKNLVRAFWSMKRAPVAALPMSDDEIVMHALQIQKTKIHQLEAKVAADAPKVEAWDELMEADGTYTMNAVAKILGWGRNVMMRELRRLGVLQGNNLPYQRYEHHFKVVPQTYKNRRTGETVPTATTYVRPAGVEFLRKKLAQSTLAPTVREAVDA